MEHDERMHQEEKEKFSGKGKGQSMFASKEAAEETEKVVKFAEIGKDDKKIGFTLDKWKEELLEMFKEEIFVKMDEAIMDGWGNGQSIKGKDHQKGLGTMMDKKEKLLDVMIAAIKEVLDEFIGNENGGGRSVKEKKCQNITAEEKNKTVNKIQDKVLMMMEGAPYDGFDDEEMESASSL